MAPPRADVGFAIVDLAGHDRTAAPMTAEPWSLTLDAAPPATAHVDLSRADERSLALKYIETLLGQKADAAPPATLEYIHYLQDLAAAIGPAPELTSDATPPAAPQGDAYDLINWFVTHNPDFVIRRLENGFVLVDPDAETGAPGLDVREFAFADGSMIILVGLPAQPDMGLV